MFDISFSNGNTKLIFSHFSVTPVYFNPLSECSFLSKCSKIIKWTSAKFIEQLLFRCVFHKHDKDGLNFSTYSRMDTFVENTVTKVPNQWLNISWVPSRSKDRHSWMISSTNSRSKLFPSLLARKSFDSFWICKMKLGPKSGLPKLNISLRCDFLNGDSRRRCRCNRKPHFSGGSLQQNDIKR